MTVAGEQPDRFLVRRLRGVPLAQGHLQVADVGECARALLGAGGPLQRPTPEVEGLGPQPGREVRRRGEREESGVGVLGPGLADGAEQLRGRDVGDAGVEGLLPGRAEQLDHRRVLVGERVQQVAGHRLARPPEGGQVRGGPAVQVGSLRRRERGEDGLADQGVRRPRAPHAHGQDPGVDEHLERVRDVGDALGGQVGDGVEAGLVTEDRDGARELDGGSAEAAEPVPQRVHHRLRGHVVVVHHVCFVVPSHTKIQRQAAHRCPIVLQVQTVVRLRVVAVEFSDVVRSA